MSDGFFGKLDWAARRVLPRAAWGIAVITLYAMFGIKPLDPFATWAPLYGLYVGGAALTILLLALLRPKVWTWGRSVLVGMAIAPVLELMVAPLILHHSSLWKMLWISAVSGVPLGAMYGTMFWFFWGRRDLSY